MRTWKADQKIGRYELLEPLGEGAACQVWLAVARGPGPFRKRVALKLLKGAGDREAVDQLLREARLVALLDHPCVVPVLEADTDGTDAWITLEYVEGGTLRELTSWIKRAGLGFPLAAVLDLAIDVAEALEHAHEARDLDGTPTPILHRDLKPENVLLDRNGHARLTDFGLASIIGRLTPGAGSSLRGTARYVPPEIWRGERDYRPASDLFAFGCVLFELLTLRRLFDGSTADIQRHILEGDPARDVLAIEPIAPQLAPYVERLIQRDPDRRCATASQLLADLVRLRGERADEPGLELFLEITSRLRQADGPPVTLAEPLRGHPDPRWAALARAASPPAPPRRATRPVEGARGLRRRSGWFGWLRR